MAYASIKKPRGKLVFTNRNLPALKSLSESYRCRNDPSSVSNHLCDILSARGHIGLSIEYTQIRK